MGDLFNEEIGLATVVNVRPVTVEQPDHCGSVQQVRTSTMVCMSERIRDWIKIDILSEYGVERSVERQMCQHLNEGRKGQVNEVADRCTFSGDKRLTRRRIQRRLRKTFPENDALLLRSSGFISRGILTFQGALEFCLMRVT